LQIWREQALSPASKPLPTVVPGSAWYATMIVRHGRGPRLAGTVQLVADRFALQPRDAGRDPARRGVFEDGRDLATSGRVNSFASSSATAFTRGIASELRAQIRCKDEVSLPNETGSTTSGDGNAKRRAA